MTQYDTAVRNGSLSDSEICEYCAERPGTPITINDNASTLCSHCVQEVMTFSTSGKHMKELLASAYRQWLELWAENPTYLASRDELLAQMLENAQPEVVALQVLAEFRIRPRRQGSGWTTRVNH